MLAAAQAFFIATSCFLTQLWSWLVAATDGYVHAPKSIVQWIGIAVSFEDLASLTKSIGAIAALIVLVIDFLVITGREKPLEQLEGVAFALGLFMSGLFAFTFLVIGFFTSFDGDPAFATGWYTLIAFVFLSWVSLRHCIRRARVRQNSLATRR